MTHSNYYLTVRRVQCHWQPVLISSRSPEAIWSAGWHYSDRYQAEQAAQAWAREERCRYVQLGARP